MKPQHVSLAAGRWHSLTLFEQLGNVGSEVGRTARARQKDAQTFDNAVARTLELIDLTIADPRHRQRLKEITRARELFCEAISDEPQYDVTLSELDEYFLQFAIAARLKR